MHRHGLIVTALVLLLVAAAAIWGFKGIFFSALLLTPTMLAILVALTKGIGVPLQDEG